jgi:hypothetical protein
MTRFLLLFLIFSGGLNAMALPADTSAYQFQRLKINSLLAERSAKFGQYDLSLNARTGIFGLQTKNDLRNSNEILRGIILSDNNIFRELKILMNYKDQEVQQVQNNASSNNKRIEGYMLTIKKLQQQNDELKAQAEQVTEKKDTNLYLIIVLVVVIAGWGIYSYSATRRKQ